MSRPLPGNATPHCPSKSGLARLIGGFGLRSRLFVLIGVTAVPALAVLALREWGFGGAAAMGAPDWHDAVTVTGSLLVLGGALMSVGFGVVVGEHVLRRPTEALLDVVERWTAGDLSARVDQEEAGGAEFGRLAVAFNRLADSLERRHDELRALNAELEGRVAERTLALSEANGRLVAEMAERERAEATLLQTQKLQAAGQLAGKFAHDFNNVLTSIVAALDVLRGRTAPSQEAALRLIDSALNAGERGRKLTGQLLSFSGRQRLAPMPTDLNDTVAALVDLLGTTLGAGVGIETAFAADLWPALVDPSQVEAAILNLAINGRDAMPQGGRLRFVTRNVVIDRHDRVRPGAYVAVDVSDTGMGMDPQTVRMAFEPFFTTKTETKASGLGLSQVHGLAQQSRGDVAITSSGPEGTTVTLLLPRAEGGAMPVAARAEAAPVEPSQPPADPPAAPADPRCRGRLQVIRGGMAEND